MKKKKLFLSSLLLALTLAFASVGTVNVYAEDDPQGGTEKKAPPSPTLPTIEAILAILGSILL